MNGIIVDIKDGYAAALLDNGDIKKIPDENYELGQTIDIPDIVSITEGQKKNTNHKLYKRLGALAASFAVVLALGSAAVYAMPYGTVSIDGDAAITYTINRFDYVLDVKADNTQGESVLSDMDLSRLRNRKVDEVITETLEQIKKDDKLVSEINQMKIVTDIDNNEHSEKIKQGLEPLFERESQPSSAPENKEPENKESESKEPVLNGGEQNITPRNEGQNTPQSLQNNSDNGVQRQNGDNRPSENGPVNQMELSKPDDMPRAEEQRNNMPPEGQNNMDPR